MRPQGSRTRLRYRLFGYAEHGDATEELGVEVGGLLGHDFAGSGDLYDEVDIDRIEEEGDLRGTTIDGIECGRGFTFVGKIGLGGHGVWSDAEGGFENALVKENHIKFALQRRKAGEDLGEISLGTQR